MRFFEEYKAEYARQDWQLRKYLRENGVDQSAILFAREIAKMAIVHALKNTFEYYRGKLWPSRYLCLIETTKPGENYRSYQSVQAA